ncbi:MAG: hypothetical protein JWQ38_1899 [Flavipsychrobacter sp.]|nr:hypothetical protein [Flavipsychrobacter sp.]
MRLLLFTLAMCLTLFVSAQTPSVCTPDTFFTNHYENDIKDLAVKRIYDLMSPDTVLIEIPPAYCDTIRNAMAPIFNLNNLLEADSVFRRYCVHSYPFGNIHTTIKVVIDPSYSWTAAWVGLTTVTGYADLDAFMSRYNYQVTGYSASYNEVTLSPTRVLNDRSFVDSLKRFSGITDVYFSQRIGGAPYGITYERGAENKFIFLSAWGDCPSGCLNAKYWTYTTDDNCNVTLVSVTQHITAPTPHYATNCYPAPVNVPAIANAAAINVYPNPVNDQLYISIARGRYMLTNMLGQTMQQGAIDANKAINVSEIPSGMYFLNVVDDIGRSYNSKLIKQ